MHNWTCIVHSRGDVSPMSDPTIYSRLRALPARCTEGTPLPVVADGSPPSAEASAVGSHNSSRPTNLLMSGVKLLLTVRLANPHGHRQHTVRYFANRGIYQFQNWLQLQTFKNNKRRYILQSNIHQALGEKGEILSTQTYKLQKHSGCNFVQHTTLFQKRRFGIDLILWSCLKTKGFTL